MIRLAGLDKIYRTDDVETTALSDIHLEIEKGELVAITGPSGCGKSSLLNILGMIDRPDRGNYFFLGMDIASYSEKQRAVHRKSSIGFIFQNFNLVNELTVFENIELPLLYSGIARAERKERVESVLEQMNMIHRLKHYPQQLSGGQQQRVAIARAICNNPSLLLADEPTGNLDSRQGDEVMNMLLELNMKGTTVLMVTHSEHYSAACRRVIHLLDGTIVTENVKSPAHV